MPAETLALVFTGFFATGLSHAADPPPDMDMLEFLGHFETADGRWLDPLTLGEHTVEPAKPAPQEKQPPPKEPQEEKRHD